MPNPEAVIEFFRRNNGLGETPGGSNCNWITHWYGMGCAPWCAMTTSRALAEAGFGDPENVQVPGVARTTRHGWAYCPYVRQNFIDAGRWVDDSNAGQPGDLIIFDWTGDGVGDHIGVVESRLSDGTYLTWEGNTSADMLHQRRRSQGVIQGFCRLPYDGNGGPPVTPAPQGEAPPFPGRFLRYPPTTIGGDVRSWQQRMWDRGWKRIAVDGAFGPQSRNICKQFQADKNLEVDGVVGPATWDAAWNSPVT